ncbi:MAG: hypothetical protein AB1638_08725 [Nitrospirota bacterium]
MKKNMIVFVLSIFFIFFSASLSCSADYIDLSESTVEITSPTTIQIRNIEVLGYSGRYWADFQWDPESLSFVLLRSGEDTGIPEGEWTISYHYSFTSAFEVKLKRYKNNRTFSLSVSAEVGVPYFYYTKTSFIQSGNTFNLDTNSSMTDNDTALFTPDGWSGSGQINPGEPPKTGVISSIPLWFDINAPFTFVYSTSQYNLE